MTGPGVSANAALGTAAGLASRAAPLVLLPDWVRMPSNSAQHWVRYSLLTAVSAWAAIFLYRSCPVLKGRAHCYISFETKHEEKA